MVRQLKLEFERPLQRVQVAEQLDIEKENKQQELNKLIGNLPIKVEITGGMSKGYLNFTLRHKTLISVLTYDSSYKGVVRVINLIKQLQEENLLDVSKTKTLINTMKYIDHFLSFRSFDIKAITPILNRGFNYIYGKTYHQCNKRVSYGYNLNRMLHKRVTQDKATRIISIVADYAKQIALDKIKQSIV